MQLRHLAPVALALAVAAGTAAIAAKPDQIALTAENNSGETGTATLLQSGNTLYVHLRMNKTEDAQPAHIHKGTCAKLDPKPAYPLTTIENGKSDTKLTNVKMSELTSSPYAINVHKSTKDIATYVACGNITVAKSK